MAIASMLVQSSPDALVHVADALTEMPGVTVHTTTPEHNIVIVVETPDLDEVNAIAKSIEGTDGVVGVYPVYVTTADEIEE
jgi:nitrate reductase NapAB chaperone NapD